MAVRSLTQRAIDQLSFIQVIHRDVLAEVRLVRTKLMDFILLNWITSQIEIINTFLLGSPRYIEAALEFTGCTQNKTSAVFPPKEKTP
jgi:hypothetical protein